MLLVLLSAGCGEKEPTDSTPPVDSSTPTDDTSGDTSTDDTGEVNEQKDAPVIQSCDAFCYLHETGDTFYNWRVECSVEDPQGLDNIWNGTVDIAQGNSPVATELMACDPNGFCSGTFREDLYGVICSNASSYEFLVKVQDWEQHWSAPYKVTGRQK